MNNETLSIILAVVCVLFSLGLIGFLVGRFIYRVKHRLPTGDCECCQINTKKILKAYRKKKEAPIK